MAPRANRLGLSLKLGNTAVGDTTPEAPGIRLSVYSPLISSLSPPRERWVEEDREGEDAGNRRGERERERDAEIEDGGKSR